MTTIATDGLSMAGDGQAEAASTIQCTNRRKVRRLPDGSLFGFSGSGADADAFEKWLLENGKPPKLDEMTALQLMPDGTVLYFTERCMPVSIDTPAAVGSGMDFALGAMDAGATPEEAVQIACDRDPHSGGTITSVDLIAD